MSEAIEASAQVDQPANQTAVGQDSAATTGSPAPEGAINPTNQPGSTQGGAAFDLTSIKNADDYERALMNRDFVMGLPDNAPPEVVPGADGQGGDDGLQQDGEGAEKSTDIAPVAKEQDTDPDPDDQSKDGDGKRPQFRFRPANDVDEEAMRLQKAARAAGEILSLDESLMLAKRKLGIADTPAPAKEAAKDDGDPDPKVDADIVGDLTVEQIEARMAELDEEELSALEDMNTAKVREIRKEMRDLRQLQQVAARAEQHKAVEETKKWDSSFNQSVDTAGKLYPDFMVEGSDFHSRCKEIDDLFKQTKDPRFDESDKPLKIAQMVARELGIAPASAAKKAEPTKAPAQTQQPRAAITPKPARVEMTSLPTASGASRTQPPATSSLTDRIKGIKTPEQWEALELELAGRR